MRRLRNTIMVMGMAAVAVSAVDTSVFAQRYSQDTRAYFDYGEPFYSNMVESPDGRSIDVRVGSASAMFSFVRTDKPALKKLGSYYAIREVTVEVVEKGFTEALANTDVLDTIVVKNYDETTAKDVWHPMNLHLALPQLEADKHYAVRLEVRDGSLAKAVIRPVIAELRTPDFKSAASDTTGIAIGDVTLLDSWDGVSGTSQARGNTYNFSRDVIGSVPILLSDNLSKDALVDISVKQVSNPIDPSAIGDRGHVLLKASDIHKGEDLAFVASDTLLHFRLAPSGDPRLMTALFTMPGKTFEQGKYEFSVRVSSGSVERKRTNDVRIMWQNMPLSLEDPLDAVEPLQHILSDDQFHDIKSGDKQEMTRKIYAYWKKQDPTPGTAMNERMAAFYQRVDYADFNFGTSHLLNGVLTDRGKVYVLYGAPTNIERSLLPGQAPFETWTYANNVQRIFHFEDKSGHGDYHLTVVKSMASLD